MKSVFIVLAFVGLAFGASVVPEQKDEVPVLWDAFLAIGETFNTTAVAEIYRWYAENDEEVIAVVENLGSDNFIAVVRILQATPEFVEYVEWIDWAGIPIIEALHNLSERFGWGLTDVRSMTEVGTKTWRDMVDDIQEIINEDVLVAIQEVIVDQVLNNAYFHEYIGRTLHLQPIFNELAELPEFLAVGDDFRNLGVDVDLGRERLREYIEWLASIYN